MTKPHEEPDVDITILPKDVRRELATLSDVNRERVEVLLAKARLCLEDDPEQASSFAQQAAQTAGRLAVVREAAGVAAYHAGQYALAKKELQAARRMSNSSDLLPMIADCERGLDKPERAIELAESPEAKKLRGEPQAELLLVLAGAYQDQGQAARALEVLETAATQTAESQAWAGRLYYAYADALLGAGKRPEARDWFSRSAMADADGVLDGNDRIAEIDELN